MGRKREPKRAELLHTQACLEYAAKTRRAFCIMECSDERRRREQESVVPAKLIDIRAARKTCQVCGKSKKDTRTRSIKNVDFEGSCGDSFCFASCDMDSCTTREFSIIACDECGEKMQKQQEKKEAEKKRKA